jgi:CubicO group peptidase (beta-lactamase class C family)
MQLVEQGLVSLDSPDDVAKHLPELVKLPLLKGYDDDGKAILVEPKNKITLRMLMSHTAGEFEAVLILRPLWETSLNWPRARVRVLCLFDNRLTHHRNRLSSRRS